MTDHRSDDHPKPVPAVSRRGLLAGAGAAALATSLVVARSADAATTPKTTHPDVQPDGEPQTGSIGSAPMNRVTYRAASFYDFRAQNPGTQVTYGGSGVYAGGTASELQVLFDLPPGAQLYDIEWYILNTSADAVTCKALQIVPGGTFLQDFGATVTIPANGTGVVAGRAVFPSAVRGPFDLGSRLVARVISPNATVQVNGVRLGYLQGAGAVTVLPKPIRAYDSHITGGRLASGSTRRVTLPASAVPAGASAAIVNITATKVTRPGYLKVYPGNESAPADSTLTFTSGATANQIIVGIPTNRTIKIFASHSVDVIVDLTGFIS